MDNPEKHMVHQTKKFGTSDEKKQTKIQHNMC